MSEVQLILLGVRRGPFCASRRKLWKCAAAGALRISYHLQLLTAFLSRQGGAISLRSPNPTPKQLRVPGPLQMMQLAHAGRNPTSAPFSPSVKLSPHRSTDRKETSTTTTGALAEWLTRCPANPLDSKLRQFLREPRFEPWRRRFLLQLHA